MTIDYDVLWLVLCLLVCDYAYNNTPKGYLQQWKPYWCGPLSMLSTRYIISILEHFFANNDHQYDYLKKQVAKGWTIEHMSIFK
jgi:hypothetical protein